MPRIDEETSLHAKGRAIGQDLIQIMVLELLSLQPLIFAIANQPNATCGREQDVGSHQYPASDTQVRWFLLRDPDGPRQTVSQDLPDEFLKEPVHVNEKRPGVECTNRL